MTTTCLDCEGNVLVSSVARVEVQDTVEKEGKEKGREEARVSEAEEGEQPDIQVEEEEEGREEDEVWVAEGEARREQLVLPGSRESTALYQVIKLSLSLSLYLFF